MSQAAAKELEDAAAKSANEAIRLDVQGAYGMAIQYYQRAISTLIKLAQLYPDYKLNGLYLQRAMQYQERIKALQLAHGLLPESAEEGGVPQNGEATSHTTGLAGTQETVPERPPVAAEPLKSSYQDLIIKEKPSVKWSEVVGLEDVKRGIREAIVYPVQRPDLFPLGWPRGILLYGPPGCGKTLIAAATASEIDGFFISVDAASIMSKWLGEAEKNVAKLFHSARKLMAKNQPVIIFIDEIDSLLGQRSQEVGGEVRVRNQFLKEMDGVADKGKDLHLYVIGATNKPWALDMPFLRRFQKRIYVPPPGFKARMEMLRLYTMPLRMDSSVDLEELARLTEGYTGSDIRDICQAAQLRVVSELFESGMASDRNALPRPLTMSDFREILRNRRPSVAAEMVRAYMSWTESFKAL